MGAILFFNNFPICFGKKKSKITFSSAIKKHPLKSPLYLLEDLFYVRHSPSDLIITETTFGLQQQLRQPWENLFTCTASSPSDAQHVAAGGPQLQCCAIVLTCDGALCSSTVAVGRTQRCDTIGVLLHEHHPYYC